MGIRKNKEFIIKNRICLILKYSIDIIEIIIIDYLRRNFYEKMS